MLLNSNPPYPKRGDIWLVDFNPAKGAEIQKTRPAVIVSSDAIGVLPIKLVVPITTWNDSFADKLWLVKIKPDGINGLTADSAIDSLQIRGVAVERCIKKIGRASSTILDEISTAVAIVVEYQ